MNSVIRTVAVLAATALTACSSGGDEFQSILVDQKELAIVTGGAPRKAPDAAADGSHVVRLHAAFGGSRSSSLSQHARLGESVHRVIQGTDGAVLFAYDVAVVRGDPGTYVLKLKPAAQQPTFSKERSASIREFGQSVVVELMENPQTGAKLTDAYRFVQPVTLDSLHRDFVRTLHLQLH